MSTTTPSVRPLAYGLTLGATMSELAKISISLDDDLYRQVRDAAGKQGVSAWLAAAASARLRADALLSVADEIASETGGPLTGQELEQAHRWLRSSSTAVR